jgi:hypothetical protein
MPEVINGIIYVVSKEVAKQRPMNRSLRNAGQYFQRATKDFQKHGPEIFCWLDNYKINLHHF